MKQHMLWIEKKHAKILFFIISLLVTEDLQAVNYYAKLSFEDGTVFKTVYLSNSVTFNLSIQTSDSSASMSEYFIGFSGSNAENGGVFEGLNFVQVGPSLTGWTYNDSMGGSLTDRYSTARAISSNSDLHGPFTRIVDTFQINPTARGIYTIAPDFSNFDVLMADQNDSMVNSYLLSGYESITLVVTSLPGDANGDGMVDVGDLGILAANYGTASGATWGQGDFNSDGAVDVGDLGILASCYGEDIVYSIPEPISWMLFGVIFWKLFHFNFIKQK